MWSTVLACLRIDRHECVLFHKCHRVLKPGRELILGMYHRYGFFHAYTIFINGFLRGKLRRLGYRGQRSMIQTGADGVTVLAPLVKMYS